MIVDKIPFIPPDDPVFAARKAAVERRGGNWFAEHATIDLKQKVGRLIRNTTDRGCVALMDGRLTSRGYGSQDSRELAARKAG